MKKKFMFRSALAVALAITVATVSVVGAEIANNRTLKVDFDNVITEEFKGIGSNLWGGSFTETERKLLGTNEANFALTEKRTNTIQPGPIRMLLLPEWFVDYSGEDKGEANWKNGVYDFTTEEMQTVVKYCEMFKESGTDVQINYGAVCAETMSWYPVQDTFDESRAAPADLEAFAKGASAVLQYLWDLGFDNVKYLSFYNETDANNWQAFGDEREYWVAMLKAVDAQLKADGIRNKIKIIGTELTAQDNHMRVANEWLKYIHDNASGTYDLLSVHPYWSNNDEDSAKRNGWIYDYDSYMDYFESARKVIGDDELWATEINSDWSSGTTRFNKSQATVAIACANAGLADAQTWFYMGTNIPTLNQSQSSGFDIMWEAPAAYDKVTYKFAEAGLLMRYIPKNSKVVTLTENYDDIHAAAFLADDGNVTVVIESDVSSLERDLTINFGKNLNKTFRKHTFDFPDENRYVYLKDGGNAILPASEKEITVTDTLTDTMKKNHQLIIYTTMDEAVQVVFEGDVAKTVKTGNDLQINVSEVYGTDNDSVSWSIYSVVKPDGTAIYNKDDADMSAAGQIDQNGKYSAANVPAGTEVAIKATSAADNSAYGIVYVKVTQ